MATVEDIPYHPCRFYLHQWPAEGDVVMATVTEVKDTMSYVTLPEYGDQEAMLPHSELSHRRLRSVHKHVRPEQRMCVKVTRVLPGQGYVDVSKRQVDGEEEKSECQQRYARGKTVQSIIRRLGGFLGTTSLHQLEDLNQRISWKLDALHQKQTAAYDVFQQAYSDPDVLCNLNLDPLTFGFLTQVIQHRFAPKHIKICGEVQVTCFGKDGVDAIKHAFNAGKMAAITTFPVQVSVMAPPSYSVTCLALTSQGTEALASVQRALGAIENTIRQYEGGRFHIRRQPVIDSEGSPMQICA